MIGEHLGPRLGQIRDDFADRRASLDTRKPSERLVPDEYVAGRPHRAHAERQVFEDPTEESTNHVDAAEGIRQLRAGSGVEKLDLVGQLGASRCALAAEDMAGDHRTDQARQVGFDAIFELPELPRATLGVVDAELQAGLPDLAGGYFGPEGGFEGGDQLLGRSSAAGARMPDRIRAVIGRLGFFGASGP